MENCQSNSQLDQSVNGPRPDASTNSTGSPHSPARSPSVPLHSPADLSIAPYKVFISHAGEDKTTIAFPLREKLRERGITAFVDKKDMLAGMEATPTMIHAMRTASVGVFVMSPEFVARKWPMKELMHFLARRDECKTAGGEPPLIIPLFYRLGIHELYDEPRLDRNDKDGNNLYAVSRFYERQRNEEPEANIASIKAALAKLHDSMGLENVPNANNEGGYCMHQRRDMLLEKLCDMIFEVVPVSTTRSAVSGRVPEAERDVFEAHFDRAYDVSELVFDFDRQDSEGNVCTQEGKILQMLLETSSVKESGAITVRGICGVGKTSLLRKIRNLDRAFDHFKGGIYYIELGKDATVEGLKDALTRAVSKSGGKKTAQDMHTETDMREVIQAFWTWFANKQCLFLIDDVWETKEMTCGIIHYLFNLHTSGRDSKTMLTTRDTSIATAECAYFCLEPRETLSDQSRAILYHYAGLKPGLRQEDNRVVNEILERCAGLPLFLGVAGKGVKSLSLRRNHEGCMAYHRYANQLKTRTSDMVTTGLRSYQGLLAALKISIELVEERKNDLDFDARVSMAEMHRRLSVVNKQTQVPMSTLKHLWEFENESQAEWVAKEFEQVGLADVEFGEGEYRSMGVLRLHDSVYEFALHETRVWKEEELGHEKILEGYSKALRKSAHAQREWWDEDLRDDKYIHRNVCRHLDGAGYQDELFGLLLSPKWLKRQVELNGVKSSEEDFSVGDGAMHKWKEKAADEKSDEMEEALGMIRKAVTLSSQYILKNPRELWFQMQGRLKRAGECNKLVSEYVKSIQSDASKPQVWSLSGLLMEAGGAKTSIGRSVECMVMMKDVGRVACGCCSGDIALVNVRQSVVEARWRAHDEEVSAIDAETGGMRLVSGSADKTVKVWNAESGECLAIFDGHSSNVRSVAITRGGKRVVSAYSDQTVQMWDIESRLRVGTPIRPNFHVYCMAIFQDAEHAVIGGEDGKLEIWNVATNAKVRASFRGHTKTVRCAALTRNGNRLVTGSDDCTIRVWDVKTSQQVEGSFEGHTDSVRCVVTSEDGCQFVSGSDDATIRSWDIKNLDQTNEPLLGHTAGIIGVSFLGESDSVVSCSFDGIVHAWNLKKKSQETVMDKHSADVTGVSFSQNGKFVVSGSEDGALRLWDTTSGQSVGEPMKNFSNVNGVAVTPDDQFVVSVTDDHMVCLWDLQTRKVLQTFEGHTDLIWCVALTPDGERAVTGSRDQTVRIWDLSSTNGNHVLLKGHSTDVKRVFVSDDGKRIISVDYDENIIVWDMETHTELKRTMRDEARLMSRRLVLSLAQEATMHDEAGLSLLRWNYEIVHRNGSEARVLGTLDSRIRSWDISPDKGMICVGLEDGRVGFLKLQL